MRILLDEPIPHDPAALILGHQVSTVLDEGWTSIKNGKLLALASMKFVAFITADRNLEFQQNLAKLPVAVVVLIARKNRVQDIEPLLPELAALLNRLPPSFAAQGRRIVCWPRKGKRRAVAGVVRFPPPPGTTARHGANHGSRRTVPLFFFSREEPWIHVHVAHPDGEAKFWLTSDVHLAVNVGLTPTQIRQAQAVAVAHQKEIEDAWSRHFGG